jgi:hypothetical protein
MWKAIICVTFFALLGTAVAAQQLVMISGHHMIALRDFSQDVGAVLGFDSSRNAISITLGYQTVEVIPYSTTAWIDGNAVTIPNPVVITDDITYLPFRFMSHALNLSATWSNNNQQVVVVNPYTDETVPFLLDLSFGQRSHVYRRDYDVQEYRNLPPPPTRTGSPPRMPTASGQRPNAGSRPAPPQGGNPRPGGHNGQPQGATPRAGGSTSQPRGGSSGQQHHGSTRAKSGKRDTSNNGK